MGTIFRIGFSRLCDSVALSKLLSTFPGPASTTAEMLSTQQLFGANGKPVKTRMNPMELKSNSLTLSLRHAMAGAGVARGLLSRFYRQGVGLARAASATHPRIELLSARPLCLLPLRPYLWQVSCGNTRAIAPRGRETTPGLAVAYAQVRSYKVRASLKLLCSGCRFVKRKGKLRVVCTRKPRHKQRQG